MVARWWQPFKRMDERANARRAELRQTLDEISEIRRNTARSEADQVGVPADAEILGILELRQKLGEGLETVVCPTCFCWTKMTDWSRHAAWHEGTGQ